MLLQVRWCYYILLWDMSEFTLQNWYPCVCSYPLLLFHWIALDISFGMCSICVACGDLVKACSTDPALFPSVSRPSSDVRRMLAHAVGNCAHW